MPPPQMNRRRHNQRGGFEKATEQAFQKWLDAYLEEHQTIQPPQGLYIPNDYDWEDVDDLPW